MLSQCVGMNMLRCGIAGVFTSLCLLGVSQSFLTDDVRGPPLRVGSFNVKWFGVTKSSDKQILDIVSRVIQRYDVMLMLEIRDDDQQTAMTTLLRKVNMSSPFSLVLSKPLGRHPNFYAEQYGFFFRTGRVTLLDTFQYNDSTLNEFEREPFSVLMQTAGSVATGQKPTAFIASHIEPKNAKNELNHMVEVVDTVSAKFHTDRLVVLGDLNADCSYMSQSSLATTPLRTDSRFKWLIPDNADTTVSTHTDCAYDRIIVTKNIHYSKTDVFTFDESYGLSFNEAWGVSDHYPVETTIYGL